ncbi:isocitrate lyase/phosphoenolpyruvate mutase family protein, partial [Ramlibacter sp.]|uniref:P-loop NTPase n=1 Tax=Ramlibacter sp. TaxID=1917967 RepID=UPI0025E1A485
FGTGGGQEAADTLGVPLMAQIPLMPALREGGDTGTPLVISDPDAPASEALLEAACALVRATKSKIGRPLNLMAVPGLPPIQELAAAGMRRLSVGPATFQAAYGAARARVHALLSQGAVDALFADGVSYPDMQRICAARG